MVSDNLNEVLKNIELSRRISKEHQKVKLVAVSKFVENNKIKEAINYGINDFGENRPQELEKKFNTFPNVNWHQIGTLQKNKVKLILDKTVLIHSLCSESLAKEINKRATALNIKANALIQVNISKEESKQGLYKEEVIDFIEYINSEYKNINILGLMTMAPFLENPEETRPFFKGLKNLLETINNKKILNNNLKELSMGMSNDYKIAIEEGATIVRVGSKIFKD